MAKGTVRLFPNRNRLELRTDEPAQPARLIAPLAAQRTHELKAALQEAADGAADVGVRVWPEVYAAPEAWIGGGRGGRLYMRLGARWDAPQGRAPAREVWLDQLESALKGAGYRIR